MFVKASLARAATKTDYQMLKYHCLCRCPDDLNVWEKTIYARTNGFLRAEFEGVENFEYHDEEEFKGQSVMSSWAAIFYREVFETPTSIWKTFYSTTLEWMVH